MWQENRELLLPHAFPSVASSSEPMYRAALNITEDRGDGSGAIPGLRSPALLTLSAGGMKTGDLAPVWFCG